MTKAVRSVARRDWQTFFPQAAVAHKDDLCKLKDTVAPGVEIFVPRGHKVRNLDSPMLEVAVEGRRYFAVFKRFVLDVKGLYAPQFNETAYATALLNGLKAKVEATGVTETTNMWVMEAPWVAVIEGDKPALLDIMASIAVAAFDIVPMNRWEKLWAGSGW